MLSTPQYGVAVDLHIHPAVLDTEDIETVFLPDVEVGDPASIPRIGGVELKDGISIHEFEVVGDPVGAVADRGPCAQLPLREDDGVRTVAKEKLFLRTARCA